jgi:L-fucose isomerase
LHIARIKQDLNNQPLKSKNIMTRKRFQGEWPKIGIRPTIDGRMGGVRESLETQTMNMAKSVVSLLTATLKYPDGTPVQCVIADSTIGRVAESAACAEKFRREGVGVTITVTPCWCYGSETMDMEPHTVKAVWGFNGTERPGAVYLAAVLAGHAQKGLPAFGIYGRDVQDAGTTELPADVKEKLLRFAKAALAVATMRGKSYLSIGAVCMGIAGSIVNTDFFEDYLGMRCEGIDEVEIIRRMTEGIYDKEEYEKALAWAKANCKQGEDNINRPDLKRDPAGSDKDWEFIVKMTLIVRDLMAGNPKLKDMGFGEEALGHNAIVAGFQGQRQWTDFYPNGDFTEAILNSSFDWTGIRSPYVLATENDALNGTAMLFGYLLTNTAQIFADVRTYWSAEAVERVTGKKLDGLASGGMIHLINSGAATLDGSGRQNDENGKPTMKPFWNITEAEAKACLDATTWMPANREYFRGGGFSSKFLTRGGMPCTMVRLNLVKGLGPVLQIAEGWTVELEPAVHKILDDRTDKGWPTTWFVPRLTDDPNFKDVYSVMNNWGANHGSISCGHIGADLITLASMLRIPVCMHNVSADNIYRPAAWAAFGMDKEGADYRACQTYGPLYK